MLRDGRKAHGKRLREIHDRKLAGRETRKDRSSRGIRKGSKGRAERVGHLYLTVWLNTIENRTNVNSFLSLIRIAPHGVLYRKMAARIGFASMADEWRVTRPSQNVLRMRFLRA